tara:strand:- start:1472 stop:2824 length:1353 start_codon:yes stop_codon:yes gene_type:complete
MLQFIQRRLNYLLHYFYIRDLSLFDTIIADSKLSTTEQNKRRLERLNELIIHAYNNVPYYKRVFSKCDIDISKGLKKLSDLSHLPILAKDDIRENTEDILFPGHKVRKSFTDTSGGSTGAPIIVFQDAMYKQEGAAMFQFIKQMRGINPFGNVAVLWGAARDLYGEQNTIKGHIIDFVTNSKAFNSARMTEKDILSFIKFINKKNPDLVLAYAQSIYEIALFAEQHDVNIKPQRAIHTGAGQLFSFMRETIERVFQCKVYDHYGGREFGAVATECDYGSGLHVLGYNRIVEIVDKQNNICKDNEEGEIVVTVLNNFSMPLIRYKVGDVGLWSLEKNCACGNNYRKILRITGRTANNFPLKEGGMVSGEYLTLSYNNIPGIVSFQIRQKNYHKIIIYLITDEKYQNSTEDYIRNRMLKLFGSELQLNYQYVDEIPTTSTGKHLFTVSEIAR